MSLLSWLPVLGGAASFADSAVVVVDVDVTVAFGVPADLVKPGEATGKGK